MMSKYEASMKTPTITHLSSQDFDIVYEPAEDSFLLIDALEEDSEFISELNPTICLEVGSGSGVVITALSMFLGSSCHCVTTDISHTACKATQNTGHYNNQKIDSVNTDLVCGITHRGLVDLLIFNPPYVVTPSEEVATVSKQEDIARTWAGGVKGREVMDRLFPSVPQLLSEKGVFYLLVISDNSPPEIEKYMSKQGFFMSVVKERKIRGEHLLVLRFRRKEYKTANS